MIEVTALTKKFNGVTAVDEVSLSVAKGETLILLGTSGCGKTTTLKMINRLIEPTAGNILVAGADIRRQKPEQLRQRIGYVIQNIGLFPHYTIAQNIATVPELLGWNKKRVAERTHELLTMLGLPPEDFLHRYPRELSGGQKQRVGIARALAADPPVILLDEPFGALDPITRQQIRHEFKSLENLIRKTMVLVTHDVFEAAELGDKICLMDRGRVQQIGTPKELVFSPANEFVQNFFRANRFQLELRVLTLEDIISKIQPQEINAGNVKDFTAGTNLLTVLETLEQPEWREAMIRIVDGDHRPILTASRSSLLAAFYQANFAMTK